MKRNIILTLEGYFSHVGTDPVDNIVEIGDIDTTTLTEFHKWDEATRSFILDEVMKTEHDLQYYRELRAEEYPSVEDQLDEIMKWLSTETEFGIPDKLKSIAMQCMAVKAKYPKPKEEV